MSDDATALPPNPVFTEAVRTAQSRLGSRGMWASRDFGWRSEIDADMAAWLAERDSFYFATASADGQPYMQHRGGPKGLLKPIGQRQLAFADFTGNRQYLTVGNLSENAKAHIFVMDYANRQRVKFWGRARIEEDDADLLAGLVTDGYRARVERAILFEVTALDINCPQHIMPRYDEETVRLATTELGRRIAELEAENADLKARLAGA